MDEVKIIADKKSHLSDRGRHEPKITHLNLQAPLEPLRGIEERGKCKLHGHKESGGVKRVKRKHAS